MVDALERLIDRSEIQDCMLRYARGVDRRDWELVRSTFFEDGTDHHGDFRGTRDEFITWVSRAHAQVARSTHLLGNCLIEFASDDAAVVETHFHAILELGATADEHRKMLLSSAARGSSQNIRVDVLGRYVDRFEKRAGKWAVARRRVAFDATHAQPATGNLDTNVTRVLGRRDSNDAVFVARAEAGL